MESTESDVDHTLLEVGYLDAASIVLEFDLILDTADIMICEGSMQVCVVKFEFLCNTSANAWMLPKTCALDTGAGRARAVTGAWFLEHATADTSSSFAHFLHLPASRGGEATAHLGLSRLGRVPKFVDKTLGLRVWMHGDRTREGGRTLSRGGESRVMFLKAVEEKLFMTRKLLIPRG